MLGAQVSRFHARAEFVGKRGFCDIAGKVVFVRPIPKCGSETVRRRTSLETHALDDSQHGHVGRSLLRLGHTKNVLVSATGRLKLLQQINRRSGQGNTVFAMRLHSCSGDGPDLLLQVDFRPFRAGDFPGPCRCQYGKLQCFRAKPRLLI